MKKTKEEYLIEATDKITLKGANMWDAYMDIMESYADQQNASIKSENDRLIQENERLTKLLNDNKVSFKQALYTERNKIQVYKKQIKELQLELSYYK